AGLRHRDGLVDREDVRRGEHVLLVGEADHLDLEPVAHAGLLEVLPERPVEEADGREVLHAAEPDAAHLVEEDVHQPERIGAADAGEHGRLVDDREHLARHVDDDRVRVAVRQEARERHAPGHPGAARGGYDDQVGTARLGALGREPRARAGADDRVAGVDLCAEPRQCLASRHSLSPISEWSRFAIASANSGSFTSWSTSCTSTLDVSTSSRRVEKSASSASASWKTWPSVAIAETPRSGT